MSVHVTLTIRSSQFTNIFIFRVIQTLRLSVMAGLLLTTEDGRLSEEPGMPHSLTADRESLGIPQNLAKF